MPTYSYRCTECDNAFDIHQAFTDDTLTICPVCGGKLRKVFSPVGVSFSGSGFYRTDSRAAASSGSDSGSESGSGSSESGSGSSPGSGSGDAASGSSGAGGPGAAGSGGSGSGGSGDSTSTVSKKETAAKPAASTSPAAGK